MLDIYICEDDEKQLAFTQHGISDYCMKQKLDAAVVFASVNPFDILAHFRSASNPALFFLDIDLNAAINGIELAGRIRELGKRAFIVFLTSHAELTLLTFQYKVEALDFIVKDDPHNIKSRIHDCIDTALARHTDKPTSKTIKIALENRVILLDPDEITFIETTHVRHKLRLHARNRLLEFNAELKAMENQLRGDGRFVRVHKSYIVNRNKIESINRKEKTVIMLGGGVCPLSRAAVRLLFA
jgi:two-component system response regulator AgrA